MSKRPQSASSLDALFDIATEAMEVSRTPPAGGTAGSTQSISIYNVRPDPFQARRILPPPVRIGFVTGQLDPPGALAAWRALADDDPREADLLQSQIIGLATSIRQQALVNPVTVYSDGQGGYLLETGERRWWAHWWLVSVENQAAFEELRAQVVLAASPERQAAENLQDSPLTAVQEACQIARLLLHLTGRDNDHVVAILQGNDGNHSNLVGYDPYRGALELDRSDVYGKWSVVSQVMGRGERQLLRQLAILKLADGALSLADRGGLTEGQLRSLVAVASDIDSTRQHRIVSLAIAYDLSGVDIARLIKTADLNAAEARIRRQKGLDQDEPASPPAAIRRPSSIMVDRLRSVRRLAARHEKGGLQIADLVEEIVQSAQADRISQELAELSDLLLLLRDALAGRLGNH